MSLYPRKQTSPGAACMSARCQSRPNALQQNAMLFDHLVGGDEQAGRHREAERLRGFEVQRRFKLSSCLHRKVGRTVATQDTVNIKARLVTHVGDVDSVGYETSGLDDGTK